jgi:hypothetical protein
VQHLACKKSQVVIVTFNSQLSLFQGEEEGVPGGHPVTTTIQNDLAEVLLGLFVPWNRLPALFQQHAADDVVERDAYAKIWKIVEPTLSLENRNFASNIKLLRKFKEDSRIDAALRRAMDRSWDSFNCDVDDEAPVDLHLDADAEELLDTLNEALVPRP